MFKMLQPSSSSSSSSTTTNGHSATPVVSVAGGGECPAGKKGRKVNPGGPVGPKDQLDYMVRVLGLTAVYQEFPKKQPASSDASPPTAGDNDGDGAAEDNAEAKEDDEVFTLLSISTEPPQVNIHILENRCPQTLFSSLKCRMSDGTDWVILGVYPQFSVISRRI